MYDISTEKLPFESVFVTTSLPAVLRSSGGKPRVAAAVYSCPSFTAQQKGGGYFNLTMVISVPLD